MSRFGHAQAPRLIQRLEHLAIDVQLELLREARDDLLAYLAPVLTPAELERARVLVSTATGTPATPARKSIG